MVGKTHTVGCGEAYFISPKHRTKKPTNDKCVWTIGLEEELNCFNDAIVKTWFIKDVAWGVQSSSINEFNELGINYENASLVIAKFLKGTDNWHGYPADINKRPQDRPKPEILTKWQNSNVISKPYRARIQGGRI